MKSTFQELKPQEYANKILFNVLKKMRNLGDKGKLLPLNPVDGMGQKVL
jgi:hypothetical protein